MICKDDDFIHSGNSMSCCARKVAKTQEKCGVDEGDSDDDSECRNDLICGTNNCQWFRNVNITDSGYHVDDGPDCCTGNNSKK